MYIHKIKMSKLPEILFKHTVRAFIVFLTLAKCNESIEPSALEGERAELDLPYPCNSTEVTLQRSNGSPFYSSAYPDVVSSPQKNVTNHFQPKSNNCSLHLIIDPVSRNDEGTYIPTAYENGMILPELRRIWLKVDYPPGKASCESSSVYIEREWVTLQCQAPAGSLAGQIVCYQNGQRLPPLTPPEEYDRTVHHSVLARLLDAVYCCSSISEQTKDMCECNEWGWNFTHDSPLTNMNPCPAAFTTQSSTSFQGPRVDIKTSIPISTHPTHLTQKTNYKWPLIGACVLIGILLIIILIMGVKYKQGTKSKRTDRKKKYPAIKFLLKEKSKNGGKLHANGAVTI